jgi:glutathione S-transferase
MQWALKTHALQPQGLSSQNIPAKAGYSCVNANIHAGAGASVLALIAENDGEFKPALDAYKYPERNPHKTQIQYRADGEVFLQKLENLLQENQYLFGDTFSMADIAIFPFVRQFAAVDAAWFEVTPYVQLRIWLRTLVESALFLSIMEKRPTHINM